MKHLVLGVGQIGRAISLVLRDDPNNEVIEKDVAPQEPCKVDVLHVCIPYSTAFEGAVSDVVRDYAPAVTIIHSTVPVGTSRHLRAVHSPVTGRHPNLYASVKTFVKYFGGIDADIAADIFVRCGVSVSITPDQETTEAGKLWQTLQYGWLILLQKEGFRWMRSVGADPVVAYEEMNAEYTYGYDKMGLGYTLPIMEDVPGPIGGHCVIPNTKLTDTLLSDLLAFINEKYKDDPRLRNPDSQ